VEKQSVIWSSISQAILMNGWMLFVVRAGPDVCTIVPRFSFSQLWHDHVPVDATDVNFLQYVSKCFRHQRRVALAFVRTTDGFRRFATRIKHNVTVFVVAHHSWSRRRDLAQSLGMSFDNLAR
jgi:hypothetical protein